MDENSGKKMEKERKKKIEDAAYHFDGTLTECILKWGIEGLFLIPQALKKSPLVEESER